MTIETPIAQRIHQFRRAFRQNDVLFENDCVTGKMRGFFFRDVDQVAQRVRESRADRIRRTRLETTTAPPSGSGEKQVSRW